MSHQFGVQIASLHFDSVSVVAAVGVLQRCMAAEDDVAVPLAAADVANAARVDCAAETLGVVVGILDMQIDYLHHASVAVE